MTTYAEIAVIVVAAGSGQRAGGGIPKQFRNLGGMPVLARTLNLFCAFDFHSVIPVIGADQFDDFENVLKFVRADVRKRIAPPVLGGNSRQASVLNGLQALVHSSPRFVLIHDGARALTPSDLVQRVTEALQTNDSVVPALLISDTVKEVSPSGMVSATLNRNKLRTVQTPQGFRFQAILDAHQAAVARKVDGLMDDASVMEWAGLPVRIVPGAAGNLKITTVDDFEIAERQIFNERQDIRVGQGYDVHSFVPGDHIWLGGVKIAHTHKLNGHSDSDVLLHAMTDAILGALGDGDIGVHFPPSDNQWRGMASKVFLAEAIARLHARGGVLAHLDGTLVCEAPKIGPHREAIRAEIASIAGISLDRVGLKATTSEKLGFVGRKEGVAAFATATVRLP